MKHCWILRSTLTAAALLVPLDSLRAQVVRYSTDFPDATGWTLDPPASGGFPSWLVDATPASVAGAPAYHSAPNSLNFNDGHWYGLAGGLGITYGNAVSPAIDLSAPAGACTLSFWCAYDTETDTGCGYDKRRVQVSSNGFQNLLLDQCYDTPICGPVGQWHQHTLQLQPSWGMVQVRFYFNTVDGLFNDGAGWFVDDFSVVSDCVPPSSYCTAKVNSQGCTPFIYSTGYPSPSAPLAFRIRAGQVLNNKPGLLLYGYASAAIPFQGGFLCVASPITRITVASSGGNPPPSDCSGIYVYDFNDKIRAGTDPGLVPGANVFTQYWSRDPLAAFGSGLSDGLTFVICP